MAPPLRQDYHLSPEGLRAAQAVPAVDSSGPGCHKRRRESLQARVEAAVEAERALGNLMTPDDGKQWILRVMDVMLRLTARVRDDLHREDVRAEYVARETEIQRQRTGSA